LRTVPLRAEQRTIVIAPSLNIAGPAATDGSHRDLIPDSLILLPLTRARNAVSPGPRVVDPEMADQIAGARQIR